MKPMAIEIKTRPLTPKEKKIMKEIDKHEKAIDSLAAKLANKKPKK